MSAAAAYIARMDAVEAQRTRLSGGPPPADRWGGQMARLFRADPRRALDANLAAVAEYVRADDVLVDVGGGAGRMGLPMALRCRELVNVEPSPGMGDEFEAVAQEAGITNARLVRGGWQEAGAVEGDVLLVAHVTYFVREIVPFIEKLQAAARRRVILFIASPPPPARSSRLFRMVHGEDQVFVPGQAELLPVLWEMGILPDVRVLPGIMDLPGPVPQTREDAIKAAVRTVTLGIGNEEHASAVAEQHFDELFAPSPAGYQSLYNLDLRALLVTWEMH